MPGNGNKNKALKTDIVHVLFNGMFFLEYQKDKLIAITPPVMQDDGVMAHEHLKGIPGKLVPWTANEDLSNILIGEDVANFPQSIPQFSRRQTRVGNINAIPGALTVTLPRPIAIFPLRIGKFSDFPGNDGIIFRSMEQSANGQFSMVTCLRYRLPANNRKDWPGGSENKCHFYAEPHCDMGPSHFAMALSECKKLFSNQNAFDLTINQNSTPSTIRLTTPRVGYGVTLEDEKSLGELNHCTCGTNVANCGQIGVNP